MNVVAASLERAQAYENEITKLREQVAAQAAVIERLREALEYYANQHSYCNCDGCEQLRYEFGSETQHAIFALAIPTDSTQILAEVRQAERQRCILAITHAWHKDPCYLRDLTDAIQAME